MAGLEAGEEMPEASTGPGGDGRLLSFTVTKSAQG